MKDCSRCKFCEKDYYYDDELGEELVALYCEKEHDTDDLDFECKDFEEYKPKSYKEKDTECDKCKYLRECKSKGNCIDCTTVDDKRRHFLCSKENCRKIGR